MPYTKLEIIEIAERYTDKRTFRLREASAYRFASRKGWLKAVTGHMTSEKRGPVEINTKAKCRKAARTYRTRNEFREQDHTLYVTAHKHGWLDEICAHMLSGYKLRWNENRTSPPSKTRQS